MATFAILPYLAVVVIHDGLGDGVAASWLAGAYVLCLRAGSAVATPVMRRVAKRSGLAFLYGLAAAAIVAAMISVRLFRDPLLPMACALCLNALAVSTANVITKAHVASLADEIRRIHAFGSLSRAINGGAALGALGGSAVAGFGVTALLAPVAILLVISALLCGRISESRPVIRSSVLRPSMRRLDVWRLAIFVCATAMIWLGYVQFFAVLPVYAIDQPAAKWVGTIFAINAVIIVGMQGIVLRTLTTLLTDARRQWVVYMASCCAMAFALVLLLSIRTDGWLLIFLAILILSGSELLWSPLLDNWTATMFGRENLLGAFTITGLAWGGAEALASSFSIQIALGGVSGVPWYGAILMAGVMVVLAALLMRVIVKNPTASS